MTFFSLSPVMSTPSRNPVGHPPPLSVLLSDSKRMREEKRKQLSRRSSILSIIRRQSRSVVGPIPFEDRLAAIDQTAPLEVKVKKLMRLVVSVSAQNVGRETEEAEDQVEPAVQALSSLVSSKLVRDNEFDFQELNGVEIAGSGEVFVSAKVKALRSYVKDLRDEGQEWKDLLNEYKEKYKTRRAERSLATERKVEIRDLDRGKLPEADRRMLDDLLDEDVLVKEMEEQEVKVRMARDGLKRKVVVEKQRIADLNVELNVCFKRVKTLCDNLHKMEESSKLPFSKEVNLGNRRQIESWIQEVKN